MRTMAGFQRPHDLFVDTRSSTPRAGGHDWDEEARALLRRVNLEAAEGARERYRNVDAVYQHPTTGARLFVGNQTAARSESARLAASGGERRGRRRRGDRRDDPLLPPPPQVLVGEGIFHVVNCQDPSSANFFEHDPRFSYRRFPVSHWWREPDMDTAAGVLRFFERGCHAWIADALDRGHNVLVHCLAGAHRAGTTGVSFVMRQGRLDAATAIRLAKYQRPIVDPFGQLRELLARLERAYAATGAPALAPPPRADADAAPRRDPDAAPGGGTAVA